MRIECEMKPRNEHHPVGEYKVRWGKLLLTIVCAYVVLSALFAAFIIMGGV